MESDKEMSLEKICSECSSCWNMRRDDILYEEKNLFSQDFRLRFSHFLWCHMDNVIIYIWCEPWKRFRLYGKPKKCNSCSDSFPAAVYTVEFNVVKNVQCKYISPVFWSLWNVHHCSYSWIDEPDWFSQKLLVY